MSSAPPPLAAVVLAAGRGARMGGPKALLAWPSQGGTTAVVPLAIAHARARLDGDCETVTLVVEPAVADRLDAWLASDRGTALPRARLYIVRACPPDPAGSIAAALLHGRLAPLVLLTPVDCPPARADTVSLLVSRLASDSHIVAARPVAQGRRGHPVILRREVLSPAFDAPSPPPLREHLQALGARVADVAVADPHVWADLDSPASLAALGLGEPSFL